MPSNRPDYDPVDEGMEEDPEGDAATLQDVRPRFEEVEQSQGVIALRRKVYEHTQAVTQDFRSLGRLCSRLSLWQPRELLCNVLVQGEYPGMPFARMGLGSANDVLAKVSLAVHYVVEEI